MLCFGFKRYNQMTKTNIYVGFRSTWKRKTDRITPLLQQQQQQQTHSEALQHWLALLSARSSVKYMHWRENTQAALQPDVFSTLLLCSEQIGLRCELAADTESPMKSTTCSLLPSASALLLFSVCVCVCVSASHQFLTLTLTRTTPLSSSSADMLG